MHVAHTFTIDETFDLCGQRPSIFDFGLFSMLKSKTSHYINSRMVKYPILISLEFCDVFQILKKENEIPTQ